MNEQQRSAFVIAQAAMLNAEIAAMQAENQMRAHRGETPAYADMEFNAVIGRYNILTWNGCLSYLRD